MFTPQRKGWLFSPQRDGKRTSGTPVVSTKGKSIAVLEGGSAPLPPPVASLDENGEIAAADGFGELEAWRRFREVGLLDESSLEKKDREALLEKMRKLDQELYEYQYNMGLLLIEKKEWTSNYEAIRQKLAEAEEILKREKAAHLIALSEVEKREENLKKALGVQKQCVTDLEKALHEMRAESAEIKFSSDKKSTEADALVASIEEKSIEVEAKLHAADAKLAEASRKCSEMERKLQEVETRESLLRRERLSMKAERDAHETTLSKQRDELQNWERDLQNSQERLFEDRRLLNQREDMANEREKILNQKENDLEEAQKEIGAAKLKLKEKEADTSTRLTALACKEEEADARKWNLEKKEQELNELEQKLNARERVEIQSIIDEHNAILDSEKHEFELEMTRKKKELDEEYESKRTALDQKEASIKSREDMVFQREQNIEKNLKKLEEKERAYELKLKDLKVKEKSLKTDEKGLEVKKKQLEAEKQELLILMDKLEKERASLEEERDHILIEQKNLTVTEEERKEFLCLQSNLKQEIDHYHSERESLAKEREDLKQERENFEKEWEVLDEKRAKIMSEMDQVNLEKEKLMKWKHEEEGRLENKKLEIDVLVQRELETLKLEKEAFEGTMQLERSKMLEEVRRQRDDMLHDYEERNHELEVAMRNRQEEMEKQLQGKERAFDEITSKEMAHINSRKEEALRQMEEMNLEKQKLEREKQEISKTRVLLRGDQFEVQKDIDELGRLSRNLKDQREEFIKEKRNFLALVEQHKCCVNCGEPVLSDLPLLEIEDFGVAALPSRIEDRLAASEKPSTEFSPAGTGSNPGTPGSRMSWLRKCTSKIFTFSAGRKMEDVLQGQADQSPLFGGKVSERFDEAEDEPEPSRGIDSGSVDIQRVQSDNSIREMEGEPTMSIDARSDVAKAQIVSEVLSASPENAELQPAQGVSEDSQPPTLKYSKRKPGKRGSLRTTRSVKQVVQDAKAFLGETFERNQDAELNGKAEDTARANESKEDSFFADGRAKNVGRKRQYTHTSRTTTSEQDADDSEGRSDSVTTGGRRKRRQTIAPGVQTPGGRRYNLRRSTVASTTAAAQALPDRTAVVGGDHPQSSALPGNELTKGGENSEEVPATEPADALSTGVGSKNGESTYKLQTSVKNVLEVHEEFSSQKFVRIESEEVGAETDGGVVRLVNMEFSEHIGDREDGEEVNGKREEVEHGEDGYRTEDDGERDQDGDDDEDDSERHNASIGKKLWKFFTT